MNNKSGSAPVKRILFVEHEPDSTFDEILLAVQKRYPEWIMDFAMGVGDAWVSLCRNVYDGIVVDVMLPAWPGTRDRSEGVYLVAAIAKCSEDSCKPMRLSAKGMNTGNRNAAIFLLTSRNTRGVLQEIRRLLGANGFPNGNVIGKFDDDPVALAKKFVAGVLRAGQARE